MTDSIPGVGVGDVIGRYRLERYLGHGGMSIVYEARHAGTNKICALKIIQPQFWSNPNLIRLLLKEAQVSGTIDPRGQCPHIVNVFDADVDAKTQTPYLAMELLEGKSLHVRIAEGPISFAETCELVGQVAEGLAIAHRANVVHRDVKPRNIFITADRYGKALVKILDFGIAKALEDDGGTSTQVGTPAYASPEQMGPMFCETARRNGINIASQVTPQTDIWAVGLTVYEMLTGHVEGHFWNVTTQADLALRMIQTIGEQQSASERAGTRAYLLPVGFDDWFRKCTELDSTKRWRSVREAVDGLLALRAPKRRAPMTSVGVETFLPQHNPNPVTSPEVVNTGDAAVTSVMRDGADQQTSPKRGSVRLGLLVAAGVVGVLLAGGAVVMFLPRADVPSNGGGKRTVESAAAAVVSAPLSTSGELVPKVPPPVPEGVRLIPDGRVTIGERGVGAGTRVVKVSTFLIDETEVTVGDYEKCVADGTCKPGTGLLGTSLKAGVAKVYSQYCNYGKPERSLHPMNCVDWEMASSYCGWAKKRLPTEEEWEYAARGAEGLRYPWGNEPPDGRLCWKRLGGAAEEQGTCLTSREGDVDKSPFFVLGMAGNVAEWTSTRSEKVEKFVVRGGSWGQDAAEEMRSAHRLIREAKTRNPFLGFRCAMDK